MRKSVNSSSLHSKSDSVAILCISGDPILRGSVPKSGPIDFASKNHFPLNSADYTGLVPK